MPIDLFILLKVYSFDFDAYTNGVQPSGGPARGCFAVQPSEGVLFSPRERTLIMKENSWSGSKLSTNRRSRIVN